MRQEGGLLLPFGVKIDRRWYVLSFADTSFDEFLAEAREAGRDVGWYTHSHMLMFLGNVARECNGTLRFEKAANGLRWMADIVEEGDDPGPTMAQQDLGRMLDQKLGPFVSAGTLIHDMAWHNLGEDDEWAEVTKASLYEMSSVPLPAFIEAKVDGAFTFAMTDDTGSTIKTVLEFAEINADGERVAFDFAASRAAAVAKLESEQNPEPVNEPDTYKTEETVAELRERYGVPNGESG